MRKITSKGLKSSSAKLLPIGTISLSSKATIGHSSITTEKCATNQGSQYLIANKNNNNDLIFYLLKNIKKELTKRASGSTFLEISKNEIKSLKIRIPSLEGQIKMI